jgi:hypothetical protein
MIRLHPISFFAAEQRLILAVRVQPTENKEPIPASRE